MSELKKIAFVAHDVGGQKVLRATLAELSHADVSVNGFFSEKGASADALSQRISASTLRHFDALVLGGPSSNSSVELDILTSCRQSGNRGQVFLIEDSPGTSRRAETMAHTINHVIVANPIAVQWAKQRMFRSVHYFGAPAHWSTDFEAMNSAVEATKPRKKLPNGEVTDLTDEDIVLGLSGGKSFPGLLTEVMAEVRSSMESFGLQDRMVIDLLPHPGEARDDALLSERARLLEGISSIAPNPDESRRSTTVAVVQDQLMMFAGAVGPTDSITGSMHPKAAPLAYYYDGAVKSELKRQIGHDRWWPEELGHMLRINGLLEIRPMLKELFVDKNPAKRLPKMAIPSDWNESARRIADFISVQLSQ